MQLVHKHLNLNSHLMHNGRLQYGLFLKGVGLSLEESLLFFKNKYSKVTNEDKFEKEYSYNIRHYYGKEGKRADYHPWNCTKVQNLPTPGSKESHGCPFKEFSEEKMRKILYDSKLKESDVIGILEKKRNNEFSVACIRFFEAKHNTIPEKVGIHPNFYFESYMKYVRQSKNFKSKTYVNSNKPTDIQKNDELF
jgi:DNA primase large subunit